MEDINLRRISHCGDKYTNNKDLIYLLNLRIESTKSNIIKDKDKKGAKNFYEGCIKTMEQIIRDLK